MAKKMSFLRRGGGIISQEEQAGCLCHKRISMSGEFENGIERVGPEENASSPGAALSDKASDLSLPLCSSASPSAGIDGEEPEEASSPGFSPIYERLRRIAEGFAGGEGEGGQFWRLVGYDSFGAASEGYEGPESGFYPLRGKYLTESEARMAAAKKLRNFKRRETHDDIFILRPDGTKYRYVPLPEERL